MNYIKQVIRNTAAACLMLAVWTGCSSDHLNTVPSQSIPDADAASSLKNLYMAVNGIHRRMVSQDLGLSALGAEPGFMFSRDIHADDITWDTQTSHQGTLTWSINTNAQSPYNSGPWETYYNLIRNANLVLEGLDRNFSDSKDELAKHIRGECLAVRAWAHFNLVQYYAKRYEANTTNSQLGVPYRTSSEKTDMARHTVEEVYEKVNADLDGALTLLDGYKPQGLNHYSTKVLYGLKARVAMAQQKYAEAADYAVKAIETAEKEGHQLMTPAQLMNGFASITSQTKEALYAAMTQDDQTVYFYSYYAQMSWNFNAVVIRTGVKCISQSTYDLMSPTDLRRQWWDPTGKASVPRSNYNKRPYQNRKFTARTTSSAVGDVAFMRLSEMYLTAAEAYARAGRDEEAKKYLTAFASQRDTAYQTSEKSGDELAEEIMTHRRIELWGEGFRWFDLKRLNLPCERKGTNFNIVFCGFLTKGQNEQGWYYEIPKIESDYNKLIVNNY